MKRNNEIKPADRVIADEIKKRYNLSGIGAIITKNVDGKVKPFRMHRLFVQVQDIEEAKKLKETLKNMFTFTGESKIRDAFDMVVMGDNYSDYSKKDKGDLDSNDFFIVDERDQDTARTHCISNEKTELVCGINPDDDALIKSIITSVISKKPFTFCCSSIDEETYNYLKFLKEKGYVDLGKRDGYLIINSHQDELTRER